MRATSRKEREETSQLRRVAREAKKPSLTPPLCLLSSVATGSKKNSSADVDVQNDEDVDGSDEASSPVSSIAVARVVASMSRKRLKELSTTSCKGMKRSREGGVSARRGSGRGGSGKERKRERERERTNVSEVESLSKVEFDGSLAGDPDSVDVVVSEPARRKESLCEGRSGGQTMVEGGRRKRKLR